MVDVLKKIRERLKECNLEVDYYPSNPENYEIRHNMGAVLIDFDGCIYEELVSDMVPVKLRFNLILLLKDVLNNELYLFEVLDKIRRCLLMNYNDNYLFRIKTEKHLFSEAYVWCYIFEIECDYLMVFND